MSKRKRYLPFVVVAVTTGIGALLIGGPARGQTPAVTIVAAAASIQFTTSDGGAPNVTIAAGGIVAFTHASGFRHNVDFTGAQPASCTQTIGSSASVPPLPNPASTAEWAGQCTFATSGTYAFVCDIHPSMTGSVTVPADTMPPPATTPPGPPPAVVPPPPPPPPAATGPAASQLRVSARQRGTTVRGSVDVRSAGSRLLARAFARRKALSTTSSSSTQVQVGRQSRSSVGAGRVAFAVSLNAVARRALLRNGRLSIGLRLTVTPATGAVYTATRPVILKPA